MAKYVKKPIIVDAVQWNEPGDHQMVVDLGTGSQDGANRQAIMTERGWVQVYSGDWIVTEIGGLYSVCRAGVFDEEYERVDDDVEKMLLQNN